MRITTKQENGVLLAPTVFFLLLMLGFPALTNIVYSVSQVGFNNLRSPIFNGGANYLAALRDESFWQSLQFSTKFGLGTAFAETALGFFLAIFLSPILRNHRWLLAILMLPMMIAPSMMGLMYRLVLHEFVGSVPYYWEEWIGSAPAFLGSETVFWTIFTIETLQWTPFTLLLFFMAYEAIPQDVREAASVDGARPWRQFWAIEAPQMLPTLLVALIIRFIDGFRVFDNIYSLVGSGAGGETTSMSIYIYDLFFKQGQIGQAQAASMILFTIAFILLFIASRLQAHSRTT